MTTPGTVTPVEILGAGKAASCRIDPCKTEHAPVLVVDLAGTLDHSHTLHADLISLLAHRLAHLPGLLCAPSRDKAAFKRYIARDHVTPGYDGPTTRRCLRSSVSPLPKSAEQCSSRHRGIGPDPDHGGGRPSWPFRRSPRHWCDCGQRRSRRPGDSLVQGSARHGQSASTTSANRLASAICFVDRS
jgi:hypothetical protein